MSGVGRLSRRAPGHATNTTNFRPARTHRTLRAAPRTSPSAKSLREARLERSLPIRGYRNLSARDIIVRLRGLTQSDLACVFEYERSHEARPLILKAIETRRIELPLPSYDELTVEELLKRLDNLPRSDLELLRRYEEDTKIREPVLAEIERLLSQ